jgi:RNA-binding protein 5/10
MPRISYYRSESSLSTSPRIVSGADGSFPYITMPALYAHSEAQKVKIDFSTPLGMSNPSGLDTQQLEPARRHDGTRHIGQPGGGKRVLLFRMLDWNTRGDEIIWRTSQEIARLLNKVGREKEAEGCIVRVATIQDKAGRGASWGFAFVELVTSEVGLPMIS